MRKTKLPNWAQPACLALVAILFALPLSSATAESVWVRIHSDADHPALTSSPAAASLSDYGSFQWGQIPVRNATDLQNAGVRMTVIDQPFELTMGGEHFDLLETEALRDRFMPYQADPSGDFHLVQFHGPVRSEWLRELRSTGVRVVQPVQPFSYYVWATSEQIGAARSLGNVRATSPLLPEWKVQPHLRDFDAETRPTMALISRHDLRETLESMRRAGAEIHSNTRLSAHFEVVHLDVAGNRYMSLGDIPGVYTVQEITQDAGPRGEMSNQSIVGGIDGDDIVPGYLDWLNPTGYDGSGVIVGIIDGGVQENHPDLVDNIMPCTGTEGSCTGASGSHGTHVAGAVGGTGVSGVTDSAGFLRGQGVAPGAGLVNQAYGPFLGGGPGGMVPDGMLRLMKDSADSGALLTNNSWGPSGTPQGYNIPTMEIDFTSRDALPDEPGHSPVLAVWSIMNGNGDSGGACAPSSLGAPDEAKNLFGVGSTGLQTGGGAQLPINDVFSVSSNSGHGPACDGRRVPDIVAPGCRTDSTDTGGGGYGLACGTSMASPVVSGAIALWAERYIDETGTNPSPALMKAVFIAAAEDLVGGTNADGGTLDHRPDRFQGFGRLDLDEVMNPAGDFVYLMDQEEVFTQAGQEWGIGLNAADPNEPMRIMLTWTDVPGHGQGGTTPAWVNILDLEVEALDGNTYLGNVIGSDGWSEPGGSADGINNTEGVWLRADQHQGGVNLRVLATDIAGDALNPYDPGDPSQDFAIACYNCIVGDPTFSPSISPATIEACVPDSGSEDFLVDVSINAIGQYEGTVALSSAGEPAGVSSQFDPMSVEVPGGSEWTLTVDDTATAGTSMMTLIGDDGEDVHERELTLVLDEPLIDGPALVAPVDGASDLTLTPTFGWDALADVNDYALQVATDADFNDLVVDEMVEGTTFSLETELNTGTDYYWRVQGLNLCGGGVWSDTFVFTTRLEPEASFSATEFSFYLTGESSDTAELEIANTGTGNLNWSIVTDLPDSGLRSHDAALDEEIEIPEFTIVSPANGGEPVEFSIPAGVVSRGEVVGFSFAGTVSGPGGTGTWASDTCMVIESPDGTTYGVGGISDTFDGCGNTNGWDFQGSGSSGDGTYSSSHDDVFDPALDDQGEWTFTFVHDWNSTSAADMTWSDVTVTLHKAPLPVCGDELTNVDWLSVNPEDGVVGEGDSETVSVMVDTTGLLDGEYIGYLCVTTNDPAAELVPMPIELTVDSDENPQIEVDPMSMSAFLGMDDSGTQDLTISNDGEAALGWEIPVSGGDPACELPSWVDVDPLSGTLAVGASETVAVTFDSTGLAAGDYDATLCVTSNDPANPQVDVELNLTVSDGTAMISGQVTSLGYCQADPEPQANVSVSANGENVSTAADGSFTLQVDANQSPFNIGFTHPAHRGQTVEGIELEPGETVTVDADLVLREACAQVEPDSLSFSLTADDQAEQLLTVSNANGGSDLEWSLETGDGCFDPADNGWLELSHTGGVIAWGNVREVTVSADASGLAHGSYSTTLCLATDDGQQESIEVPVELEVVEPLIFDDRFEAQDG